MYPLPMNLLQNALASDSVSYMSIYRFFSGRSVPIVHLEWLLGLSGAYAGFGMSFYTAALSVSLFFLFPILTYIPEPIFPPQFLALGNKRNPFSLSFHHPRPRGELVLSISLLSDHEIVSPTATPKQVDFLKLLQRPHPASQCKQRTQRRVQHSILDWVRA